MKKHGVSFEEAKTVFGNSLAVITDKAMSQNMRQVIMYRDEDGYWVVECPSLKGCVSQGKTKEEALSNIREAITGYIAALKDDGLPVPEDTFETFVVVV